MATTQEIHEAQNAVNGVRSFVRGVVEELRTRALRGLDQEYALEKRAASRMDCANSTKKSPSGVRYGRR